MEKKGTVMKQQGIRSYLIKTDDGGMYRRNHKHINKLPPETKKQREDKEGTQPGTHPPIQPSPISAIPI